MKRAFVVVLVAVAFAAAWAGGAPASEAHESAAKVTVMLVEFKLTPSTRTVRAGRVTFVAMNMGELHHELVVLKTPTPAAKLPMQGMVASETGKVGKIAALSPGQTRRITLNLKRGHYVLICNLPGHYRAGQHADLTVR